MNDISRTIVAVRYLQQDRNQFRAESDVGPICERILDDADKARQSYTLSEKAYNYFTDVEVKLGDFVIVRGGDAVKLAIVDHIATDGDYRPFRTVVARLDFGDKLEQKRREAARKVLIDKVEKAVRAARSKEEVMSMAEHYAGQDPKIAVLLAELKLMEEK